GLASAVDLKELQAGGSLRVLAVVDEREPEFFSLKGGTPSGFDLEVLQAFARSQRLQLKVVPVPSWEALIPALLEQKGDIIAGRYTATPERRKRVSFTEEVFPSRTVLVTRRPHRPVTSLALDQEKVGTVRGTSMVEALAAAGVPLARIDQSLLTGTLSESLRSGKVTVAVWSLEGAMLAQRRDPELELGAFVGPAESLAYATRNADVALRAALDEHLRTIRRTGTWNRLAVKYFGAAAPEILRKARAQ
ncbi:MAG TPA: transporter substrate-binding domain-containing protein, partial [Vicinamibacteria bacterium]|nr:transporter substrate-binding domain-containing protein [Vicinamibacteria bacterium]